MLKILQARLQQYVNWELSMFKLDLEKADEPEIKLPTSAVSLKKQESSRKTFTSALLITSKPLTMWTPQTVENSSRDGNTRPLDLPPEKSICRSEATVRTTHGTTVGCKLGKEDIYSQDYILPSCLFNVYAEYIMWNAGVEEAQAGIKTAMEI